jgi:soluble lytic murein transglycosylase
MSILYCFSPWALPTGGHFHILLHVIYNLLQAATHRIILVTWVVLACTLVSPGLLVADENAESQRDDFSRAWRAATEGKRDVYRQLMPTLQDYVLYPYLKYEDLRFRRAHVSDEEMISFLESHQDWAFTSGLKRAWLRTLGDRGRWDSLLLYARDSKDTEVQCSLAHARIKRGETEDLVPVAQKLWAVGKSQPDVCDPVFSWLKKQDGITSGLAWERIRRAMDAREPQLSRYLARYLQQGEQVWADRWYQQDRGGYRHLAKALNWPDTQKSRDITVYGLRRLARSDPDKAEKIFMRIESHFAWPDDQRGGILREIALWSAVEKLEVTPLRMQRVPAEFLDGKLLDWWARYELSAGNWQGVAAVIESMPPEQRDDSRWRYWEARAQLETGDSSSATKQLGELALEANYHGFLAADQLGAPYNICPQEPDVTEEAIEALRKQAGFHRSLELRRAGIKNWSRSEWRVAINGLDKAGLRAAAAVATQENWPDMAIFALGNSGDLRWYEWRFPVEYGSLVFTQAANRNLDPAWVMGLMRSESAMAPDAISPVGARGLMQVMPDTARLLARQHSFKYSGRQQLMQPEVNIKFGTAYLRDLLNRFGDNPVLVSGAYNAGPHVVDRWMGERVTNDPTIWVETLPYYETRDYIPRVLAFSTLYDWRLKQPVSRLSSRMPSLDSTATNTMKLIETAEVVCGAPG